MVAWANWVWEEVLSQRLKASANVLCSPGIRRTRRSTSWSAEVNHNWRKQRYMKGSLVEPELITVTAASLSQETRNRWCCNAVGQNFTATITVKSSRAEMWDAAWRKKSGKGNVRPVCRGTWLRRESDKRPWWNENQRRTSRQAW